MRHFHRNSSAAFLATVLLLVTAIAAFTKVGKEMEVI